MIKELMILGVIVGTFYFLYFLASTTIPHLFNAYAKDGKTEGELK